MGGVGFSYENGTSLYSTNDNTTAEENFAFLEEFIKVFPDYNGRDMGIAGERYAGVYVPTLALQVVQNPSSPLYDMLQGFLVGNPIMRCKDVNYDNAQFMTFYYHGLVSYTHFANWTNNGCIQDSSSHTCTTILNQATNGIGEINQPTRRRNEAMNDGKRMKFSEDATNQPSLNPDNLYFDFCIGNGTLEFSVDANENCQSI